MESIVELRGRLGWTQEQAAQRAGVSVRTWSRWECGETRTPPAVIALLRAYLDRADPAPTETPKPV